MPRRVVGMGVMVEPDGRGEPDWPGAGRWADPPGLTPLAVAGWRPARGRLLPAIQAADPAAMTTATRAAASSVRPEAGAAAGRALVR